eukprot:scaffold81843_cov22-Tisochrysis_lutea.AAC.3
MSSASMRLFLGPSRPKRKWVTKCGKGRTSKGGKDRTSKGSKGGKDRTSKDSKGGKDRTFKGSKGKKSSKKMVSSVSGYERNTGDDLGAAAAAANAAAAGS